MRDDYTADPSLRNFAPSSSFNPGARSGSAYRDSSSRSSSVRSQNSRPLSIPIRQQQQLTSAECTDMELMTEAASTQNRLHTK